MKRLLLIDGMAIVYRAYFAFQKYPRRSSRGMNTGAIYGFTTALLEVIDKEKPTHRGVVFDTSAPTFRHKLYPNYKANREQQPEDITVALHWLRKLLAAMHIPVVSMDGYEADDIIGTYARQAEAIGFEVLIMSPDKDFAQLLSERISLYKPAVMKKLPHKVGVADLQEQYGVQRPEHIIDMLALQGDAVDNVPGVPGIGKKTAQTLLARYGSLAELLRLPTGLPAAVCNKLRTHKALALLSQELVTIDVQVPLTWEAANFVNRAPDTSALREVFAFLEFKTLAQRLRVDVLPLFEEPAAPPLQEEAPSTGDPVADIEQLNLHPLPSTAGRPTPQCHFLQTIADIDALLPYLKQQQRVAWYTETHHVRPAAPELRTLALAYLPEEAYVLCLPAEREEVSAMLRPLRPFFEDTRIEKVSAATKTDIGTLQGYGIRVHGPFFDIILAHYLHNSEANHALSALIAQYLPAIEQPALGTSPVVGLAAGQRAMQLLALRPLLHEQLQLGRLWQVFQEIELPLIQVLVEMEAKGVQLDDTALKRLSVVYAKEAENLQQEVYALVGEPFNIASPKQLGEVLFDKLSLQDNPQKTKTGHYATGEEVLQSLINKHAIVPKVLAFRGYQKLRSTYLDALPLFISPADGRVHTQYHQTVTATGRLSASHPNLQNIPIRSDKGIRIRESFTAPKGWVLLSADYAQVELRILASFALDEVMIAAFANGEDIHTTTASKIFDIACTQVSAQQRRVAKTANFGILYGISAFGLAQQLQISRKEAQALIDSYFSTFPRVQSYMIEQQEKARQQGYVETHWGRRRYLPDITSRNATSRAFAERNAINAPIQGTAADIIKRAMCAVTAWLHEKQLTTALILQIHDELLLEVPTEEVTQLQEALPALMQGVSDLTVPMRVSMGVGKNWLQAH